MNKKLRNLLLTGTRNHRQRIFMGGKWKVLIVRELLAGTKRFGELQKSLPGVSHKVLAQHLREMEGDGLIHRTVYAEVPPRVEYTLTELGSSIRQIHDAACQWTEEYKARLGNR